MNAEARRTKEFVGIRFPQFIAGKLKYQAKNAK